MSDRSCKTCRFLIVPPDARGRRVVREKNAYECVAVVPMPAMPDSMTEAFGFRWPPGKSYMTGSRGTKCPTWERHASAKGRPE